MLITQKVKEFLGTNLLKIINSPDSIESFQISPRKAEGSNTLEGYPVIKILPKLNKDQMQLLISIILDEKTYNFNEAKKCPFVAEFAYRFKSGTDSAVLLISPSCDVLQFLSSDKKMAEDYDGTEDSKMKMRGLLDELKKSGGIL